MIAHDEPARIAQAILAFRLERHAHLPKELFGETAWDFLLELFVADALGDRLTGSEIAARTNASDAIASRWLKHLLSVGLVVGDGDGDLQQPLTLSAEGIAKMEAMLVHARDLQQGIAEAHRASSRR